jgi:hypothetical protein
MSYSDAGQERWLADHGIDLLRGTGRLAGVGVVEVDGVLRRDGIELSLGVPGGGRMATAGHARHPRPRSARRAAGHDRALPAFSDVYVAVLEALRGEIIAAGRPVAAGAP